MSKKPTKLYTNDGREIVARCKVSNAQTSARKMALVADLIRGKSVAEALEVLTFTHRPSAQPIVEKALRSAIANAERSIPNPMELRVGEIIVEGGTIMYRRCYAPKGRPVPIRVRRSHLHLHLTEA
ncbi:MAG: uL22 family ribosomal protein [Candidatus Sumerlaeia bacterium]|nr:uL22 family ribosomal protein [Candidatus Sumerlaeia bacterium]